MGICPHSSIGDRRGPTLWRSFSAHAVDSTPPVCPLERMMR
jgi:hypothetical protein